MDNLIAKYFNSEEISLLYQGKISIIKDSIKLLDGNSKDINDLLKLAIIYLFQENSAQFFQVLESIFERFPNNFDATFLFVKGSFIFQKNSVSYLKYLNTLLKESSDNVEVYVLCAEVYYKVLNFVRAKECAEAALRIDPGNYSALYVMSMCSLNNKQIGEAKEYLLKAVENQSASENLFQTITPDQIDTTNLSFSKEIFRKGLQLNRTNKSLHYLYKLSYFKNNSFYKPLLSIEDFNLDNKYFWVVLGIIILLIPIMFLSSDFTIMFMEAFKWFATLIMLIYIPYQLFVYIFLSLMYPFSIKN